MFSSLRTFGLVLKEKPWGEADKLFSFLFPSGEIVPILGKSIRKINSKLKSQVELFSLLDIEFIQGKHSNILVFAESKKEFKKIKGSLLKLKILQRFREIFLGCQKEDNSQKFWSLWYHFLFDLEEEEEVVETVHFLLFFYFWQLLCLMGYKPNLNTCFTCNSGLIVGFLEEGTLICPNCALEKSLFVSQDFKKMLETIDSISWTEALSKWGGHFSMNVLENVIAALLMGRYNKKYEKYW